MKLFLLVLTMLSVAGCLLLPANFNLLALMIIWAIYTTGWVICYYLEEIHKTLKGNKSSDAQWQ